MIDTDRLRERIRERLTESDGYSRGQCDNCNAQLTEADYEAQACTNCDASLPLLDQFGQRLGIDDESADEHLYEDEDY